MQEILTKLFGQVSQQQMKQFYEELGKRFVSKADYNAKAGEAKALAAKLSEREESGKADEVLQGKLASLQKKYDEDTAALQESMDRMRFEYALDRALTGAKARNNKAVRALLDLDKLSLEGDGIAGLEEQIASLRRDNGFLFESNVPSAGGRGNFARTGGPAITAEQFSCMTYTQRMKLYNENKPLYEQLTGGNEL